MNPSEPLRDEVHTDLDAAQFSVATLSVHADDVLNTATDVAPPIHVATTFRYPSNPDDLIPVHEKDDPTDTHVYSRATAPNSTRLEVLLSALLHGHAITYSSGLAAFHALLVYFRPNVIALSGGYHGCHGVIALHKKLYNLQTVDLFDEAAWDAAGLGPGDLVHVETPVNPTGEARDLAHFVARARARGALVTVDSTFGPPGLQDPFVQGVDVVLHSGTKYIGGHSDLLLGILVVPKDEWRKALVFERLFLGCIPGSLEGWLGVRSLRTLELRVQRQSSNAEKLVRWLVGGLAGMGDGEGAGTGGEEKEKEGEEAGADKAIIAKTVDRVLHASLQKDDMPWLTKQMPGGFGPVFAVYMKTGDMAKRLPSKLKFFHHATSLGGVESLIEWRTMSDEGVDPRLLRISVGVEGWEDLRDDLLQAFKAVAK